MTTLKLTPPLVIAYTGNGYNGSIFTCMSAQYQGPDAPITLQPIQWNVANGGQLWRFGNDGRIYLDTPENPAQFCVDFPSPPQNGSPLLLSEVKALDQTQMWNWDTKPGFISNVADSTFAIDNNDGNTSPGNKIQVWQQGNTQHQIWTPLMMPTYFLTSKVSEAVAAAR